MYHLIAEGEDNGDIDIDINVLVIRIYLADQ